MAIPLTYGYHYVPKEITEAVVKSFEMVGTKRTVKKVVKPVVSKKEASLRAVEYVDARLNKVLTEPGEMTTGLTSGAVDLLWRAAMPLKVVEPEIGKTEYVLTPQGQNGLVGAVYNQKTSVLTVMYQGKQKYRYLGVPAKCFHELVTAPDPKEYLTKSLRGVYSEQKVRVR